MLRFFVLLLILANGAYFAWSQGLLASFGYAPTLKTEPGRMAAQIKPDAVRPLSSTEAARVTSATAPKPSQCLQSPLLDEKTAQNARTALANSALPPDAWTLIEREEPARWIVYMGKYPGDEALAKKKTELRQLSVAFEALKNTSLEPGLSLGGYETKALADARLADVSRQGVRTARVLQELPAKKGVVLKLPALDETQVSQLQELRSALGSQSLSACKS
jgi:hypothetical protein